MIEYNKSPIIGYDEYENSKDILIVYDHSEIRISVHFDFVLIAVQ